MELLKQVAQQHQEKQVEQPVEERVQPVITDDDVFASAIAKAKETLKVNEADETDPLAADAAPEEAPEGSDDSTDKGLYGGRQVEFKQDVYRIPQTPSGDVSQPVGLLTMQDLNNYVLFKKGDRLNFKWKGGTSGQATYEVTRNGDVGIDVDIEWTDPLIRELEDEGAITLMSA